MDMNSMTPDKYRILGAGKLMAYCEDTITAEPPCHAERISELYDSFTRTGYKKSGETPLEKLHDDFPDICENELDELTAYFKQADDYISRVCSAYAMIYPYPVGSANTAEEREDMGRAVTACRQRYPWLTKEYIEMYLKGVVAMCIR